jgi:hypothetical protein
VQLRRARRRQAATAPHRCMPAAAAAAAAGDATMRACLCVVCQQAGNWRGRSVSRQGQHRAGVRTCLARGGTDARGTAAACQRARRQPLRSRATQRAGPPSVTIRGWKGRRRRRRGAGWAGWGGGVLGPAGACRARGCVRCQRSCDVCALLQRSACAGPQRQAGATHAHRAVFSLQLARGSSCCGTLHARSQWHACSSRRARARRAAPSGEQCVEPPVVTHTGGSQRSERWPALQCVVLLLLCGRGCCRGGGA